MSTMTTPARLYSRECSICRHPEADAIDQALAERTPITQLSRQFKISRDVFYRHLRHVATVDVEQPAAQLRALSLLERMASIAEDARRGRVAAYSAGNLWLGARLGDSELRVLEAMADRFKLDHDALTSDTLQAREMGRKAHAYAVAVESLLPGRPELAEAVAVALDREGLGEMAALVRADNSNHELNEGAA